MRLRSLLRSALMPALFLSLASAAHAVDPTVSILSPSNGSSVAGAVHVNVSAASPTQVVKVEFLVDGSFAYRTAGLPYSFGWDTTGLTDGAHTLTATAYNNSNQSTSQTITVTVNHSGVTAVPTTPSIVQVSGRQLLVQKRKTDGTLTAATPYLIKGFTWTAGSIAPTRGYNPYDPSNPAGFTDYGYFFDWTGRNPQGHTLQSEWTRNRYQGQYAQDASLMKSVNANTVRVYNDFGSDAAATKSILDEFYRRGIMVILTVVSSQDDISSGRYLQTVNMCKNHPAILMWALGNEWNLNRYYYSYPDALTARAATEQAAQAIKQIDPNHPVSSSLADRWTVSTGGACGSDDPSSDIPTIVQNVPSVDLWGLNVYRGAGLGTLFTQWQSASTKPMFLGEFGTDAVTTTAYTPPAQCVQLVNVTAANITPVTQSQFDQDRWNELRPNLSGNDSTKVAVGGFVHEFADQIWKAGNYNVGMGGVVSYSDGIPHYQQSDFSGFLLAGSNPDSVFNEEYFGAVQADRTPRDLFYTMQSYFAGLPDPQAPTQLPAPTGLNASSVAQTSFTLGWSAVTGAAGYRLDVSASSSFATLLSGYNNLDLGNVTSKGITGLAAGTQYYARLRAYDASGVSSPNSATLNVQTQQSTSDTTPPTPIPWLGLSSPASTSLQLQWQPATDNVAIGGYQINVSVTSNFSSFVPGYQAKVVAASPTSSSLTGLSPSTVYYVNMRAVDTSGNVSSLTDTVSMATSAGSAPPAAPSNLSSSAISQTGFTVNWPSVATATGYRLDVSPSSSFSTLLSGYNNLDIGNVTSKAVTGLSASTVYYVRLRAYNAAGTSASSSALSVTTSAAPTVPAAPTGLSASAVTSSSFSLGWSAVGNATGYRVDVSIWPSFNSMLSAYNNLDVGNVTALSVTGLSPSTVYYTRVRAYNSAGTSANSASFNVTTQAASSDTTPPSPIPWLGLSSFASTSMSVQWQPATDNVAIGGYQVSVSLSPTFSTYVGAYQNKVVPASPTSFSITGLLPNTLYYVKLRAVDTAGNVGAYTDTVNGRTTP